MSGLQSKYGFSKSGEVMKPFNNGTKVQVLWSAGDNPAKWTNATVVGAVRPNMKGIGQSGNVVKIDGTSVHATVTESGMIRKMES